MPTPEEFRDAGLGLKNVHRCSPALSAVETRTIPIMVSGHAG
jgi:hypothetical protein